MSLEVSKGRAQALLSQALAEPIEKTDTIGTTIRTILRGSHKTYRYILITALLAKATNEKIDILSLQARDESEGAYDARSLCHKVIVPFEREKLPHSLGDSNEPYLNKPARFTRLSLSNAVRDGNDLQILTSLVETLPLITTKEQAFEYLSSAVFVMQQIHDEYEKKFGIEEIPIAEDTTQGILDYIERVTERACEGETCPLIVSAMESLCFPSIKVIAHKVNQCGASSKEVGDIDIFKRIDLCKKDEWVLVGSFEVKDKDFSEQDVQHAITKFQAAGVKRSLFIYGKQAVFNQVTANQVAARYGRIGTYCAIISVIDYCRLRLYNSHTSLDLQTFVSSVLEFAKSINAKEDTILWIKSCLNKS